jgi:N-acetylneuraminic acid mutarotase
MKSKLFISALFIGISTYTCYPQWITQSSIPVAEGQEGAVAHPDGNIYIMGGYNNSNDVNDSLFIFNQATNTWTSGAPIPNPTRGMAYTLGKDSLIYIFGGFNLSSYVDSCYKYNPKTNVWTSIAHLPVAVWYAAAATAQSGLIYVMGGEAGTRLI